MKTVNLETKNESKQVENNNYGTLDEIINIETAREFPIHVTTILKTLAPSKT